MATQRKIIWARVDNKVWALGDKRYGRDGVLEDVELLAMAAAYHPMRVLELTYSDGVNETILPGSVEYFAFRHEGVEVSDIIVPNQDADIVVPELVMANG